MRRSFLAVSLILGTLVLGSFTPLGTGASPEVPGLDRTTLLVTFHPGQGPADLGAFAAEHGARIKAAWTELNGGVLGVDSASAGEALLGTLLALPSVSAAEFDFAWQLNAVPNDPRWSSQWGPKSVKLPEAWEWLQDQGLPTYGSHDVRVAVFDTGADLDHPDLAANICASRSFISGAPTAQDDNDHGSHTAGIIAAAIDNGVGVAGAGNSCLYIGKVCDSAGNCQISAVGSATNWALNPDGNAATDDKVHVISMSFGGPVGSSTLASAMSQAWEANVLPIASAGNENCGPVGYPAAYAQVMGVGALEVPPVVGAVTNLVNGQTEIRAPYSNCGLEVEIAAPGSNILSTIRDDYASFSGTSMAAPMVSGIAALVKVANPALTNAQIRCVLDQTAQDYGIPKGLDVEFGHGKVRADLAVQAAEDGADCVNYQFGIGIGSQTVSNVHTPPL